MARVVVVGLGPAGADLLVPRARAVLERVPARFARTTRHPAVADLARDGLTVSSFDHVYDSAEVIDDVYPRIVDELVAAAREHGEVVYAVPGSPGVAERSVAELRDRAEREGITVEVVPGLSFADLAWSALGVDPMRGARVVDGRALDPSVLEAGGPVLFAQVDDPLVCSDLKLALLDHLAADTPVVVLQRLGRPDEAVTTVALADLDRVTEPDHLTSVFVELPAGAADTYGALVALSRRLRGPGGCPWDAEQTHESLTRYLLEEAYEVVDAIEALPDDGDTAAPVAYAELVDELGDLLFQVVFHTIIGEESGTFTAAEIAQGIHGKLVRRHPHVFGDVEAETAGDVVRTWEQIKKDERGTDSLVDSIPPGLPALLYTHKLFRKAASVGLEPAVDAVDGPGAQLAAVVARAQASGVDAESALRGWALRYRDRFRRMEALARDRGLVLDALDGAAIDALWTESAS